MSIVVTVGTGMVPEVLVFSVRSACSFLHIVVQMCSTCWSGWLNPDQKKSKKFSFNGERKELEIKVSKTKRGSWYIKTNKKNKTMLSHRSTR